ncbi:MAG: GH36-type glycosyl hydrolase domain-containing protein [Limnohabitans sp.]
MARHGKTLAQGHRFILKPGPDLLRARLAENEKILHETYAVLRQAASARLAISPAGEWLLDNFYLVEEQIRIARQHYSKGYSRALPLLTEGPSKGFARVYDIALEAISHGDGRLDLESLPRLITAYQSVDVLRLGELWAIPIMLRLAMIENLRRVGTRIAKGMTERTEAAHWADQMMTVAQTDPKGLVLVVADMARSEPSMAPAFVAELVRRLRGQSAALTMPLNWLELRLAESGQSTEQVVQEDIQQQAASQLSISNSIGGLRALGATDWRDFVEAMSTVEHQLREDPGGVYAHMDFATRDQYRHVVERLAREHRQTETEIARLAVSLANIAAQNPLTAKDTRRTHVGYYLVDEGLPLLLIPLLPPSFWGLRVHQHIAQQPLLLYLGAMAVLTLGLVLQLVAIDPLPSSSPIAKLCILTLMMLGCSQLAVSLVNWYVSVFVPPHRLARMDYQKGLQPGAQTLVVVPTMLGSEVYSDALAQDLELRYLANQDPLLFFGLLTDFRDASAQNLPSDDAPLQRLRTFIEALNVRHGNATYQPFFLFHRPRCWNASERVWMGAERKRGKLAALNQLLQDGDALPFDCIVGNLNTLHQVRYVITLDTDTQLPRDAARKLVGTLAHPLNRAVYDPQLQRVTRGYGILQPRMAATLPSTNASWYARLFGGDQGVDLYTGATSDVYQDLFGEGSFIGKGIYDVAVFEQALADRFPDNRILSHDLLEGCYARCGLVSDVTLYEDTPTRYLNDVQRRHRWIRGDWQIAAWLRRCVPLANGQRMRNPLSMLSQWKLFDNLRRSLVSPALMGLLVLGWVWGSGSPVWVLSVLGILFFPALAHATLEACRKSVDIMPMQHVRQVVGTLQRKLLQSLFMLACLPYEAWYNLDAIVRTWARLLFTQRPLLEWQAASGEGLHASLRAVRLDLWPAPVSAVLVALYLLVNHPTRLWVAAPILLLWLTVPWVELWLSRPLRPDQKALNLEQKAFLGRLARRTWHFFEVHVTAQENHLPPDNYQEHPSVAIAHRTSPTNIGLSLLANLAALDMGYLSLGDFIERTRNTFQTLQTLPRYQGHFYNWYDTRTLEPMPPLYVSTVDSGNLVGHLLTLRSGLLALSEAPELNIQPLLALHDTLGVLKELIETPEQTDVRQQLRVFEEHLHEWRLTKPSTAGEFEAQLTATEHAATQWQILCQALPSSAANHAFAHWVDVLYGQAHAQLVEFKLCHPCTDELAQERRYALNQLASQCQNLAHMQWDFLQDPVRHLLRIGYNVDQCRQDDACYDLLASEARLASFVAIAQGQVSQENWFALGRLVTSSGGPPILLSWSGSMFEYLMPLLVMPSYENTLLDQTCRSAVQRQMAYGQERGVAWGISESGYNAVDASLNYQYRAFGVPGTGLKRGLAQDLVIAPYASALALLVMPVAACQNLQRLAHEGLMTQYGMYEAIDHTPARLPRGAKSATVRSFMAHHQGMTLLAVLHALHQQPMQKRFMANPLLKATDLLLHERIPNPTRLQHETAAPLDLHTVSAGPEMPIRIIHGAAAQAPEVQLLSNGCYHLMLTSSGAGYSRWKDLAVTRWREDPTRDHWGQFCYLRDVSSGRFWSVGHQPSGHVSATYQALFSEGRAEFRRHDDGFETHAEISVSPEDDIELRRLHITNTTSTQRILEITTYAEVVLAPAVTDSLHPAFSNLFVQTEILENKQAILCTRRTRENSEPAVWLLHLVSVHGGIASEVSYETDRRRFVGRTRNLEHPLSMSQTGPLSGTCGAVLDPVVAIRHRIHFAPLQTITIDMVTGMADTRVQALALVDKYRDAHLANRVFDLAWTHGWVHLQQLNASEADAQLYNRLASAVIFAQGAWRAEQAVLQRQRRGQSGLWSYAISGDLPIVLLRIDDVSNIELVRQLVQAHTYWRRKGLVVDLVIWNEDRAGYWQVLQEQIMGLIASGLEGNLADKPGGIFVRVAEQISPEDRDLFLSVARIILSDTRGTLAQQVAQRDQQALRRADVAPRLVPRISPTVDPVASLQEVRTLQFANGLGGFSPDGCEYIINLQPNHTTPAPWVNVLANAMFGCVVSESGASYTWFQNAHEYRLTPWSNDAVSDSCGEAIFLRDEETGRYWSPCPLPCGQSTLNVVHHGFGYTRFEHEEHGLHTDLCIHVDAQKALKYSVLTINNRTTRRRQLSATGYVEWVLGDLQAKTALHVQTTRDANTGSLLARNTYAQDFQQLQVFFDADQDSNEEGVSYTGDRTEFLGRLGSWQQPAAMHRTRLSNRVGAGMDPCAAMRVPFVLEAGQSRRIVFRLGALAQSDTLASMTQTLPSDLSSETWVDQSLSTVKLQWQKTLTQMQVRTPDAALNVLFNGWLLYQTLSCRLWARSGFYQSGGAFGFRDQLQDSMALVYAQPDLVRSHLLLAASRQFREGDVQHWWHPPAGRGVRTQCSDDYLWLPQAVMHYLQVTADHSILDEAIPFLTGRLVNAEVESYFDLPGHTADTATLYQHCRLAVQHGLRMGVHGLPLMGSGDWNDGMNLVGLGGRGESVWLAFFLYDTLRRFAPFAQVQHDTDFVQQCNAAAEELSQHIEQHAWDGAWYRRAYFDDGTPLGSAGNVECQIDSISQSWSVLSAHPNTERAHQAMTAVGQRLVNRAFRLVTLLAPPFDHAMPNPGYIRGYQPGVRENGGQYTHAAIWSVMAWAKLKQAEQAWQVFDMINPVRHTDTPEGVAQYQVEPYVMAADVYGIAPHQGRGGWTWYTGSAAWMYRLMLESLLGITIQDGRMSFKPCMKPGWQRFELSYRHGATTYDIAVLLQSNSEESAALLCDGKRLQTDYLELLDDGQLHTVEVRVLP